MVNMQKRECYLSRLSQRDKSLSYEPGVDYYGQTCNPLLIPAQQKPPATVQPSQLQYTTQRYTTRYTTTKYVYSQYRYTVPYPTTTRAPPTQTYTTPRPTYATYTTRRTPAPYTIYRPTPAPYTKSVTYTYVKI
ncbi:unnamed protein product [Enterobius vermicularis]|uniref:Adhesive plaque matrix protein-like n=1 Tax=Enterobius vermicularis TaxID=51028 RepID=A0A0N4VH11_ENTVE|nr:unnamed protein product [Enterobius vermicularis]